jgi:pantetheine-phosphate adenylyltransferase
MNMRIAVFAGSFDPITLGHEEIIRRGVRLFDKVIVGVGVNSGKKSLFSSEKRIKWAKMVLHDLPQVEVQGYDMLTVEFARQHQASFLLRGIRNYADLEYETHISRINQSMHPDLETVFLVCSPTTSHISSTFVREIHRYRGPLKGLVSEKIRNEIEVSI